MPSSLGRRAIQGKSPYQLPDSDDPYDLGFGWLLGEGPRERNYEAGDRMTELIRSSESMKQLRADTLQEWRAQGNAKGTAHYSISDGGKAGALKKLVLTDIPAIATGDPDHLGEAFVGSYSLDYDVRGQDPDGSLVAQYKLKNATSTGCPATRSTGSPSPWTRPGRFSTRTPIRTSAPTSAWTWPRPAETGHGHGDRSPRPPDQPPNQPADRARPVAETARLGTVLGADPTTEPTDQTGPVQRLAFDDAMFVGEPSRKAPGGVSGRYST
ncbi:hypothetical protein [Streptomyces sp. YS-3]|uniref:hypothetical protein n=1 Tax=Streptomyces sp. YS-3 TaxID=3381352 RepID=UPI0038629F0D